MSKELEALKNIVKEISLYKLHGLGDENWLGIQDVMRDIDVLEQALTELEELKKRDTKILELLVELLNKQMLGQEGLVLINRIKNLLSWSDKDE